MNAPIRQLPDTAVLLFEVMENCFFSDPDYEIHVASLSSEIGLRRENTDRYLQLIESFGFLDRRQQVAWRHAIITPKGHQYLKSLRPIEALAPDSESAHFHTATNGGPRGPQRMFYRIDAGGFALTSRMEKTLYGIFSYQRKLPNRFPSTTELLRHLGDQITSFRRAHMINSFQDLERDGLIARAGGRAWKKYGYVTAEGEALLAQNPVQKRVFVPKSNRVGGGVDPKTGGTRFPRMLIDTSKVPLRRLIPKGDRHGKLGDRVLVGAKGDRRKGMSIATFSLEEGATCSPTCGLLDVCFAGKMSQQKRVRYEGEKTDKAFARAIRETKPQHYRLNTIGDFPTDSFVGAIVASLDASTSTSFGYTHWQPETELGRQIRALSDIHWDFFAVRTSYEHGSREPLKERGAVTLTSFDPKLLKEHNAFPCPYELPSPKVKNCGDCGLCWMTRKNVAFKLH